MRKLENKLPTLASHLISIGVSVIERYNHYQFAPKLPWIVSEGKVGLYQETKKMPSLGDILKERIQAYKENPLKAEKRKSAEYQKSWNNGVKFFQLEINKQRKKENLPELPFMAIRQKLVALKEIDDLRWFYYHCKKYSNTKDKQGKRNTFSKCFWGALSVK